MMAKMSNVSLVLGISLGFGNAAWTFKTAMCDKLELWSDECETDYAPTGAKTSTLTKKISGVWYEAFAGGDECSEIHIANPWHCPYGKHQLLPDGCSATVGPIFQTYHKGECRSTIAEMKKICEADNCNHITIAVVQERPPAAAPTSPLHFIALVAVVVIGLGIYKTKPRKIQDADGQPVHLLQF